MSDQLRNAMRDEALRTSSTSATPRMGTVTSYDPAQYAAKVKILPEGEFADTPAGGESGWLPIQTQWSGPGWGEFCPPSIGDQVMVVFQEHDAGCGQIVGRVFDLTHLPVSVQSGERWLVHSTGSFIKLTNDGKVSFSSGAEIDAGNLENTVHKLVTDAFQALFNAHVHTNGNGGGNTGGPTTQLAAGHLTSILKAN